MRKIAPAAFLATGILVFGGLFLATPAQADDEDESSNSVTTQAPDMTPAPRVDQPKLHVPKPQISKPPREPKEKLGKGNKRHELEQKYGKEGRLSLPPLVIRPKRDTDEVANNSGVNIQDSDDDSNSDSGVVDGAVSGAASAGSETASTNGSSKSSESDAKVGKSSAGFIAVNPAANGSVVTVKSGTMVDPKQNTAIDISNVKFSKKTPADVFIQAAQVGLYAMAAGALALSLLAASRAIRRK